MTKKTSETGKISKKLKQTTIQSAVAKVKKTKSSAKFVSFTVTAVIPTQQYGNIQPKIEVQAKTYEDARDFAMPLIQELYATYGERPLVPKITEKTVVVKAIAGEDLKKGDLVKSAPVPKEPEQKESSSSAAAPEVAPVSQPSTQPERSPIQKPEPVLKAEKAISLAMTEEAAFLIEDQIQKSVKIPDEFKQELLVMCLKKRKELKTK